MASATLPPSATSPTDMPLVVGEETFSRRTATASTSIVAGVFRGAIFRAWKSETITRAQMLSAATGAVGTTLSRIGVYLLVSNGDGTYSANLISATDPADLSLFSAATTAYTKTLLTPINKVAGNLYMVGAVMVGVTTAPTIVCMPSYQGPTSQLALDPPLAHVSSGLSDLPSSLPLMAATSAAVPYGVLLP